MVQLDVGGVPARAVARFDHVGIERALGKERRVGDRRRFGAEHLDEFMPDAFAFFLGIGDTCQPAEEPVRGVDHAQVDLEMVAEHRLDKCGLVLAQNAVVDEDADQPLADRLVQQGGGDAAVDPA